MNLLKTFNAESIFFNAFFIKSCQHCFFKRPFYRMGRVHISALGFRFLGFEILLGWGLGLSPIPVINLIFVIYYRNGMSPIAVINHKYEIYYWNGDISTSSHNLSLFLNIQTKLRPKLQKM